MEDQWSLKTDEHFCFVVLGETGAGKSTLLNSLANQNIAETGSDADSVTEEVGIYDREIEVPQPGGTNSKLKVRAVDTPGLNAKKTSYEQIFRELSGKVPHPHALFYCFQINTRFRDSDQQLLSAMSSCYGVDIWKRIVIVLTHADAVRTPMKDMMSRKEAIMKFLSDKIKLDEKVVTKVPFCLAALEDPFFPRDVPIGEGQIPQYNWKIELLAAAVSVVPPEIVPMLLKLHEQGVWAWLKRNQIEVAGATCTSVLSFLVGIGLANPALVVSTLSPIVAPLAAAATEVTVTTVTAARAGTGVVGLGSSGYLLIKVYML